MNTTPRDAREDHHGNVFDRGSGSMFILVQRASGLAHRTLVLRPWQVQALRLVASRWFAVVLTIALVSWAYFAFQTARVPLLTQRITHLERDAAKLDTLQAALEQVQKRYDQVQQMLSASTRTTPAATSAPPKAGLAATKNKASSSIAH
jgi:predicted PurR-regulated permease PerM